MFGDDYSLTFQYKSVMILFKHFRILRCPRITPRSFFWWGNKLKHIGLKIVYLSNMYFCNRRLPFYYIIPSDKIYLSKINEVFWNLSCNSPQLPYMFGLDFFSKKSFKLLAMSKNNPTKKKKGAIFGHFKALSKKLPH